jgi:glycosyltransferase involved in cell wall biosynthesis
MNHRILYLVGQLRAGGLERQLYYLLRALDRQRYSPAVAVWNYHQEDAYVSKIQALGVPLYVLPEQGSSAVRLKALRHLVRQLRPEILHSYTFHTNFAAWWATWGTKTIAVGSVRSDFTRVKKENGPRLGRLSACLPSCQVFNNFAAAETARHARTLFVPRRLLVVRNGLDLQCFQTAPLRATECAHIIAIGSLFRIKRWDRLLKAASALKCENFKFSVQIAGDGPLRKQLGQLARDLKVADVVSFLGHSDNTVNLLTDATFLVHTSESEGCPNVIMEAMACGRAVVATNVGDVPSLVEEGKTGYIVQSGDGAVLVKRIATLISNRSLCSQMGEAARAKAEREFGMDRLVAEMLAAYHAAGWRDFTA